jgi:hypothetical protein
MAVPKAGGLVDRMVQQKAVMMVEHWAERMVVYLAEQSAAASVGP